MSDMEHVLGNPTLWYSLSVAIFAGFAIKYVRKPMLAWLDSEIAKVKAELEEAKRLHEEAAATLASYQAKHQEAMQEADSIIAQAKQDAARLRAEAEQDLKATLARHENKAAARIRMAEAAALDEVRTMVIEQAMETARASLASKIDEPTAKRLADQVIQEIPSLTTSGKKSA